MYRDVQTTKGKDLSGQRDQRNYFLQQGKRFWILSQELEDYERKLEMLWKNIPTEREDQDEEAVSSYKNIVVIDINS